MAGWRELMSPEINVARQVGVQVTRAENSVNGRQRLPDLKESFTTM